MTRVANGVALRAFESLHAGAVGDHDANFGPQFAALDRVDDRLQVGASAGNQYSQFDRRPLCHRVSCSLPPSRLEQHGSAPAAAKLSDKVRRSAQAAQMSDDRVGVTGRHHGDHSEAVVKRAIHFGRVDSSEPRDEIENGRHRPTTATHHRFDSFGQHARQVLDDRHRR